MSVSKLFTKFYQSTMLSFAGSECNYGGCNSDDDGSGDPPPLARRTTGAATARQGRGFLSRRMRRFRGINIMMTQGSTGR